MKKIMGICGALVVLAACKTVDITQPPIAVTPNNTRTAVGIDVYGKARAAGNPVPRFRAQKTVPIRTNGSREDESFGEIAGSTCKIVSGLCKASIVTPANIVVPDYGPNSPALFVSCTAPDGRTKTATVNAVNLPSQQRDASAAGTGLLGAIIIGAVNEARRDNEKDDFGYNPITLVFPNP